MSIVSKTKNNCKKLIKKINVRVKKKLSRRIQNLKNKVYTFIITGIHPVIDS